MAINNINGPSAGVRGAGQERPEATQTKPAPEADSKVSAIQGNDQVRLTGESQRLQALESSMGQEPSFDAKRVEALREAVASGQYKVDAERVAQRVLDLESKLFGQ